MTICHMVWKFACLPLNYCFLHVIHVLLVMLTKLRLLTVCFLVSCTQLGLDPPIRQGQTRYPFFILQMMSDETCELTLAMSE